MQRQSWAWFRAGLLLLALLAVPAWAQQEAPEADEAVRVEEDPSIFIGPCPVCEFKARFHEAAPWLEIGADFRARTIYQRNVTTLDSDHPASERVWNRFRTRVWAKISPTDDIDLNIRLVNENRLWCRPTGRAVPGIRSWDCDEFIFDQANVVWREPGGLPVQFVVGRQDIRLGEGWLVLDGAPLAGSRTLYFDAARATVALPEVQTTLDLIYTQQGAKTNRTWLPPINDRGRFTAEYDQRGVMVYAANRSVPDTDLAAYFLYKYEDWQLGAPRRGEVYTFGARAERPIIPNLLAMAEGAMQFGHRGGRSLCAGGANTRLSYLFGDAANTRLNLEYEYRSGDNPNTDRDESFDIMWGRYPQFHEIINGYSDSLEGPPAMSTNMHRIGLRLATRPLERVGVSAGYHLLFAPRNPLRDDPGFSRSGNFRGQAAGVTVSFEQNEHISHAVTGEIFAPGNYYTSQRDDNALFLRYQLLLRW